MIRTENVPVGDFAEYLVATALGGRLAPNSEKAWDVLASVGEKLQVKARVVAESAATWRSERGKTLRGYVPGAQLPIPHGSRQGSQHPLAAPFGIAVGCRACSSRLAGRRSVSQGPLGLSLRPFGSSPSPA